MTEKRFTIGETYINEVEHIDILDNGKPIMGVINDDNIQDIINLLNAQDGKIQSLECENEMLSKQKKELIMERNLFQQKKNRYSRLYDLKQVEVNARVNSLNKVCDYYLKEVHFKEDVNPNDAVKEVVNKIRNTNIYTQEIEEDLYE